MKNINLYRLIKASPYSNSLSNNAIDALVEYLEETGADLDINIDDIIVNGISTMEQDEFKSLTEEEKENMYILYNGEEYEDCIYYFN